MIPNNLESNKEDIDNKEPYEYTEKDLEKLKAQKKVLGLLGFAVKSRNLITGYNTCLKLIPTGKLKLLIIGSDVGDNTKEKMIQKCESYDIPIRIYGKCSDLSHATGKIDKGLFGITDDGFARSLIKEIDKILSEREVF